jgi:glycosyltransferase involved in cell wall biosynthesis
MKLSVVIPSFNEIGNLEKGVLQNVNDYLVKTKYQYEVIIVDDGSSDGSREFVEKFSQKNKKFRMIKNNHGGKAIAVMTGLLESKGEIGLFTDMDQATPISEIERLLPFFDKGYDIVIGSRQGRKGAPAIRKLMAFGFSLIRTLVLGLPFRDTQCGFKAFNRKSIDSIFLFLKDRWKKHLEKKGAAVNAAFDVETLFLARKKGFKVKEVAVEWHHVGTERVQVLKDSVEAVIDILKIRGNDLLGRY